MNNLTELPIDILECISQYFTDFESFQNLFHSCKFFHEFGKDPILRLRLTSNAIATAKYFRVSIYDTIFNPLLYGKPCCNRILRSINVLLSAESVCSFVAKAECNFSFEIISAAWWYSSILGHNAAIKGFVKNYERIHDRFLNFYFRFEGDGWEENFPIKDAWTLLAVLAAYGLKKAILKNDVEIARMYISSEFACKQIGKIISNLNSNSAPATTFSPLLDADCLSFPYMKELLDKIPAYLSGCDEYGLTPLHYSIRIRNIPHVQLLLTYEQTNIMATSNYNLNALHEACQIDETEILELLGSKISNFSDLDSELFVDLARTCIDNDSISTLKFLITSPKVQHGFCDFYTLLECAAGCDNTSAAEFLIYSCPSSIPQLRNTDMGPMLLAECGQWDSKNFAMLLLDLNLSEKLNHQDDNLKTPLHYAKNQYNVTKLYLQHGADPFIKDNEGHTMYHHWFYFYYQEVQDIIDSWMDQYPHCINTYDQDDLTPLAMAINRIDIPMVDLLLQSGADVQLLKLSTYPPAEIIPRALYDEVYQVISALLGYGMDPNIVVRDYLDISKSLLHIACKAYNVDVIKALLAYGANPYVLDSNNATTLSFVSECLELTELLITGISESEAQKIRETIRDRFRTAEHQPRPMFPHVMKTTTNDRNVLQRFINQQDIEGNTALHTATNDVVPYLFSLNANVNIQNLKGETVLHNKILKGELSSIVGVLKLNPDLSIKNSDGLTACDLALSLGLEESHRLIGALRGEKFDWDGDIDEQLPWAVIYTCYTWDVEL